MKKVFASVVRFGIRTVLFVPVTIPLFLWRMTLGRLSGRRFFRGGLFRRQRVSICGVDDLQHVESYQESDGVTREFVDTHQRSVGQLVSVDPQTGEVRHVRANCTSRGCLVEGTMRFCSGGLISPDLFMSAGHCDATPLEQLYVAFNYQYASDGKTLQQEELVKVVEILEVAHPGYGLAGQEIDYVIYRLEGRPGDTWGYFEIAEEDAAPGDTLVVIQHPKGEPKQVEVGGCLEIAGTRIRYNDIDTQGGSSGSMVLNAEGRVVGVHTNGGCQAGPYNDNPQGYNFGTAIGALLEVSDTLIELVVDGVA